MQTDLPECRNWKKPAIDDRRLTPGERANHNLLDGKRKRRIARGCGRPVHEINQLLKQYLEMKKMMGNMNDPKFMQRMQRMAGGMKGGGMPGLPGGFKLPF